jgi:hypothetical protein
VGKWANEAVKCALDSGKVSILDDNQDDDKPIQLLLIDMETYQTRANSSTIHD